MIAIGKIAKGVGIKGELKIQPLTERTERFKTLHSVWLGTDDREGKEHAVESVRVANDYVVIKLAGIDSRTEADALRAHYVLIPDEQADRGTEKAFFLHELMGIRVVTESGEDVGTIEDIIRLPGGDTWVVRNGKKEILIPGAKEFIRKVDLGGRKVVIHVIEGLLE